MAVVVISSVIHRTTYRPKSLANPFHVFQTSIQLAIADQENQPRSAWISPLFQPRARCFLSFPILYQSSPLLSSHHPRGSSKSISHEQSEIHVLSRVPKACFHTNKPPIASTHTRTPHNSPHQSQIPHLYHAYSKWNKIRGEKFDFPCARIWLLKYIPVPSHSRSLPSLSRP